MKLACVFFHKVEISRKLTFKLRLLCCLSILTQEKLAFSISKSCPTVSTKFVMLFKHLIARKTCVFDLLKFSDSFNQFFMLFKHLNTRKTCVFHLSQELHNFYQNSNCLSILTQAKLVFFISKRCTKVSTKFVMLFQHFNARKTCVFYL